MNETEKTIQIADVASSEAIQKLLVQGNMLPDRKTFVIELPIRDTPAYGNTTDLEIHRVLVEMFTKVGINPDQFRQAEGTPWKGYSVVMNTSSLIDETKGNHALVKAHFDYKKLKALEASPCVVVTTTKSAEI